MINDYLYISCLFLVLTRYITIHLFINNHAGKLYKSFIETRVAPDSDLAGYPAKYFVGYSVVGKISGKAVYRISGRIIIKF